MKLPFSDPSRVRRNVNWPLLHKWFVEIISFPYGNKIICPKHPSPPLRNFVVGTRTIEKSVIVFLEFEVDLCSLNQINFVNILHHCTNSKFRIRRNWFGLTILALTAFFFQVISQPLLVSSVLYTSSLQY